MLGLRDCGCLQALQTECHASSAAKETLLVQREELRGQVSGLKQVWPRRSALIL